MSFDILKYSAQQECVTLVNTLTCRTVDLSTAAVCLTPNTAHCYHCWKSAMSDVFVCGTSPTNVICLWCQDQSGVCCAWTVPTGTVKARFEIWGPGGSGGTANCCGLGTWGSSGTYIAFTIPVTAGHTYTLCAGCSNNFCPYCCGCSNYATACCNGSLACSFVSGCGVSNAIAPGGCTDFVQGMRARLCRIGQTVATPCIFTNECLYMASGGLCGAVICQCYAVCSSGCSAWTATPVADWNLWPCIPCITVGLCQYTPIFRLPSFHSGLSYDTNSYGAALHSPVVPVQGWCAPVTCSNGGSYNEYQFTSNCCSACFMSLSSHCGCYPLPGLGGAFLNAMAGATAMYGDRGRMGMVKVTWTCCNSDYNCAN